MTRLTDIQAILLSTAAQREDEHLFPTAESLAGKDESARKAVQQLIGRGLAAEVPTVDPRQVFRADGDLNIGAIITDAGKRAIGAIEPGTDAELLPDPDAAQPRTDTKQARVLKLLRRAGGASTDELMQATGWLPHTTRAALTGFRKKGISLERSKVDGITRYVAISA